MYLSEVSVAAVRSVCVTSALTQYPVRSMSAYSRAVGIAHISHLEAGRVQLEFVEQVKGRSHDLACALVAGFLGVLIASFEADLCHDSAPCNDIRFCPLSLLLLVDHDGLQQ